MLFLTDILYYLCFALLLGMALVVLARDHRSWLHRSFALTALALLLWLATLLAFNRALEPAIVLWLGRVNFAAVVFAVFFGYLFVRAVAHLPLPRQFSLLSAETLLLAAVTAFTPLVDKTEIIHGSGRHTTLYGILFPVYLLHVLAYLAAAVLLAFRARKTAPRPARDQLALVGAGMLATGGVAFLTNAVLPYGFGDFRFLDIGTLSTILFLIAVAYAVIQHRLFSIRLFIRKTLVYGLLLSFVLAAYGALVLLVTEHLAGEGDALLTRFGVLVIAFSFDPLRRFLESRADRLLFPKAHGPFRPSRRRAPQRERA